MNKIILALLLTSGLSYGATLGSLGRNSEVSTPTETQTAIETNDYFTMLVIPDSQSNSDDAAGSARLTNTVNWISSIVESDNVQAIVHVGDIANVRPGDDDTTIRSYWTNSIVLTNLYGLGVPFVAALGNHDYNDALGVTNKTTFANEYWIPSLYNSEDWYGGSRVTGEIQDSYYLQTINNVKYLFLVVDNSPASDSLEWASGICADYPEYKVVVIEHDYLGSNKNSGLGRTYSGDDVFYDVVDLNGNVNMVLCGHVGNSIEATNILYGISRYQESSTKDGAIVSELVQNYQSVPNSSYVRTLRIYKNGYVQARLYDVVADEYSSYPEHSNTFKLGSKDTHPRNVIDDKILISNKGLYGFWEFEALYDDNEIRDWSGNGNNGIMAGGTITNGAFLCTNNTTHITVAGLYDYDFPDGMTAYAEVQCTSTNDGDNSLNEIIGTKHFGGGGHGLTIGFDSAKVPKSYLQGANYLNATQNTDYKSKDGSISRMVSTYDGATLKTWWNGTVILETNFVAGAFTDVSGLVIGNWPNYTDGNLPVMIYKAAFFTNSIPDYDAKLLSSGSSIAGLATPSGGLSDNIISVDRDGSTNRMNFVNGVLEEVTTPVPDYGAINGTSFPVTSFSTNANGSYHVVITNEPGVASIVFKPDTGTLFKSTSGDYRVKLRFDGTLSVDLVRLRSVDSDSGSANFGTLNETIRDNDKCEFVYEFTSPNNTVNRYIQFGTATSSGWMEGDVYLDVEEIE